jgi:hypothetical protein
MTRPEPLAPDSLPKYLATGLPKQDDATLRETQTYIDELLDYRAHTEPELPNDAEPVEDTADSTSGTIVKEKVTCGKESCKCADGDLHGPYLYRYWSENGVTKSEYVGTPD